MENFTFILSEINRHISVLNDDFTALSMDVAVLKSQMETIIWWWRLIIAGFVGLFITQIWQVLIMRKNNIKK